ncbi:MAG: hypothetical protein AAFN04_16700, partial [Pseudomonadota bacterium]
MSELFRDRQIEEVMSAAIQEWQSGSSMQGAMGGVIGGSWGNILSFTNAHGGGFASAETRGQRNLSAEGAQRLHDTISQRSHASRSRYGTVVKDATQAELAFAQTRVVRNHNHCHMLNILYYEVLQRYEIITRLVRSYDVALIELPERVFIGPFIEPPARLPGMLPGIKGLEKSPDVTSEELLTRRHELAPFLLEPDLEGCFDALERVLCLFTQARAGHWTDARGDAEVGEMELRIHVAESAPARFAIGIALITTWGEEISLNNYRIVSAGERARLLMPAPTKRLRWSDIASAKLIATGMSAEPAPAVASAELETESNGRRWAPFGVFAPPEGEAGPLTPILPPEERAGGIYELGGDRDTRAYFWEFRPRFATGRMDDPRIEADPEDICCIDRLITHLNYHRDHYNAVLNAMMSPHERALLLSELPFDSERAGLSGERVEGRLFDFVENRLVGVLGRTIALPLRNADDFARSLELEPFRALR